MKTPQLHPDMVLLVAEVPGQFSTVVNPSKLSVMVTFSIVELARDMHRMPSKLFVSVRSLAVMLVEFTRARNPAFGNVTVSMIRSL